MKKSGWFVILAILAVIFYTGCRATETVIAPELASSDENLFNEGQKFVKRDPEKARTYFRLIIDSYPKSFYAQRAKLAIADSYYEKGDSGSMIIAASEYREFINLYPLSPSASYAQYRLAMTFFKNALSPGRDQTKTKQALEEFKKVVTNFPLSAEVADSREKIKECEERLADHVLAIGVHYYKVYALQASTTRLTEILTEYPYFSKMDKVYFYLGDSYFRWNRLEEAEPYLRKLITDYPESKYAKRTTKRLEEINKKLNER